MRALYEWSPVEDDEKDRLQPPIPGNGLRYRSDP